MAQLAICSMLGCLIGCGGTSPSAPEAVPAVGTAAPAPGAAPSLIGVWRGTSVCTVRPSPCNDEVVVYHIAAGPGPDELVVQASKIVDGNKQDMGTLPCRLQRAERRVVCTLDKGAFSYAIDGDRMHGTLDLIDGTRYRVIEIERAR